MPECTTILKPWFCFQQIMPEVREHFKFTRQIRKSLLSIFLFDLYAHALWNIFVEKYYFRFLEMGVRIRTHSSKRFFWRRKGFLQKAKYSKQTNINTQKFIFNFIKNIFFEKTISLSWSKHCNQYSAHAQRFHRFLSQHLMYKCKSHFLRILDIICAIYT